MLVLINSALFHPLPITCRFEFAWLFGIARCWKGGFAFAEAGFIDDVEGNLEVSFPKLYISNP